MYRTRQFRIKKNSRLYPYFRELCRKSAVLYNRANFVMRQYSTAVDCFNKMKPLYDNQMQVYRLVNDILAGKKQKHEIIVSVELVTKDNVDRFTLDGWQ